jgi:A/G-specific adenine glycosylase
MIEVARRLLEEGSGVESGDALLKFEGVGKYIANAVECLSFNRPAPLVDGAVGRLLRRVYGLNSERPAYADNRLWELAARIVASRTSSCREVSLGMIDISATFCKKHTPLCLECPLSELCKYPD